MQLEQNKHSDFSSNTIAAATIQINFCLPDNEKWSESYYTLFYQKLGPEDYPRFYPAPENVSQLMPHLAQAGFGKTSSIRYVHRNGNIHVSLARGHISVSMVAQYKGWEQFESYFFDIWDKFTSSLTSVGSVCAVSLRYENHIPKRNFDVGQWLRPSDYLSASALDFNGIGNSYIDRWQPRNEAALKSVHESANEEDEEDSESEEWGVSTVVFNNLTPTNDKASEFVLNIHSARLFGDPDQGVTQILENDALKKCVNELHEDIWIMFRDMVGKELEKYLKGEVL